MITELLEILCRIVEENCDTGTISLDELSAAGGVYAEAGEGFIDTMYYDKSTVKVIPVLFLCRDKDLKHGIESLEKISDYLQRLKSYPNGSNFTWLDTKIAKEPNRIGRDEDGTYHFSCILNCLILY